MIFFVQNSIRFFSLNENWDNSRRNSQKKLKNFFFSIGRNDSKFYGNHL